jgi:hypothetical protein
MKLLDVLFEGSADLERVRDMFVDRWKKIIKPKGRKEKIDYTQKLLGDMLSEDEIRFLVLKLQKNNK